MSWSDRALGRRVALAHARMGCKVIGEGCHRARRLDGAPGFGDSCRGGGFDHPDPGQIQVFAVGGTGARIGSRWWSTRRGSPGGAGMCLEKALAGKWMLRRRGISSTMYVGMARDGEKFVAHAWLVGEGQTLTGAGHKVVLCHSGGLSAEIPR